MRSYPLDARILNRPLHLPRPIPAPSRSARGRTGIGAALRRAGSARAAACAAARAGLLLRRRARYEHALRSRLGPGHLEGPYQEADVSFLGPDGHSAV